MGANVSVRWPGINQSEEDDQPSFAQDCHAYADWIARVKSSWLASWNLRLHGLSALLSVFPSEVPEEAISWTTPSALESAAESLRHSLTESVPFALKIARIYVRGPGVAPAHIELAADLADVARIGKYARDHGAQKVSLSVGW